MNRIMDFARNNNMALLQAGMGLLGGRTGSEQAMMGMKGFADARSNAREQAMAAQQQNKTLAFLQANHPQLAAMVAAGMPVSEAWGQALKAQTAEKPKPSIYNAGNGQLYNADSGEWIQAPDAGRTSAVSTLGKLKMDYEAGLIDDATYNAAIKKATASSGMEVVSDGQGGFTIRQGSAVNNAKPMTESQAKANIFATRGEQANVILGRLENEGTSMGNKVMSNVPLGIGNYGLTPEYRQYDQAKRDFVNAVLRQESGAVISEQEFANAEKQYFPQPGDDPATIEQKRRNRETAIMAIRQASNRPAPEAQTFSGDDGDIQSLIDQYAD